MSSRVELDKLKNTRDLGGMQTKDGRTVKAGKLIRSGLLFGSAEKDLDYISGNVSAIVDFRTDQEIYEKPDPFAEDISYFHIPVLNSWTAGITWEEKEDITERELFECLQKEANMAVTYMRGIYRSFVTNAFYIKQYRKFIDVLLSNWDKAVLWHCTAGKDRAGFASVLVEELLGIPRESILEDYLKTNDFIGSDIARLTAELRIKYPEPGAVSDEAMNCLFGAHPEYIQATYEEIDKMYGRFEAFMKDALKVTPEERTTLKEMYLE